MTIQLMLKLIERNPAPSLLALISNSDYRKRRHNNPK